MKIDLPDQYLPLVITALENQYAYTRAGTTLCNYRPTPTLLKRRQESSAHSLGVASISPTVRSVIKVANVLGVKPSDIILRMETLLREVPERC